MKIRYLAVILLIAMLATLCACGKGGGHDDHLGLNEGVSSHTTVDSFGSTPTTAPTAVPTPVPTGLPVSTPVVTATPIPTVAPPARTPAVTPAPYPTATPANQIQPTSLRITKQPTGETLDEGGRAVFIARADNAVTLSWDLVSPDGRTVYKVTDAVRYFQGLGVEGASSEKLVLTNVPYTLNGWQARCSFTSATGEQTYSNPARLNVTEVDQMELRAKQLSESCLARVRQYGAAANFTVGGVSDFTFENGTATFSITMVNGAVKLVSTFRAYPATNDFYPSSMLWTENEAYKQLYWYDHTTDSNVWNNYQQQINSILANYGVIVTPVTPVSPVVTPPPAITTYPEFVYPVATEAPVAQPDPNQGGGIIIIG